MSKKPADRYRIRMYLGEWFVRTYDEDGNHIKDYGPYAPTQFDSAEEFAKATGLRDWDRLQN